jgi:hypothetical protein
MTMAKQSEYLSYLLRMWQTRDGGKTSWYASLEQPGTDERQGFATLDELFQFLRKQASGVKRPGPSDQSTE